MASPIPTPTPRPDKVDAPSVDESSLGISRSSSIEIEIPHVLRGGPEPIEDQLASLKRGEFFIVDANGAPHQSKCSLYDGQAAPQCMFERTDDNRLLVSDGLPSLNGIYAAGSSVPIAGSILLPAGTPVSMGSLNITIPRAAISPPITAEDLITNDIYHLEPGQHFTFGRASHQVLDLPSNVSRVHASIERLEDVERDGATTRIYRITNGVPSKQGTYVESPDGTWQGIHGSCEVAPGRRLRLGLEGPIVEVPAAPLQDERNNMVKLLQSILNAPRPPRDYSMELRGHELPIGDFSIAHDRSCFMRNPELDFGSRMIVTPVQAAVLGQHIREGGKLIREERYEEAINHFEKSHVLKYCGFEFDRNNYFGLSKLTGEAATYVLDWVASRSWFIPGQKKVYPSFADIPRELVPKDEREKGILHDFRRELCEIYAEEWLHAYQLALGGVPVSKKGELIRGYQKLEVDVAQFFKEQRIPLSHNFLARRYAEREIQLKKLDGFQTEEQVQEISALISALAPGSSLRIGRSDFKRPDKEKVDSQFYQIGFEGKIPEDYLSLSRAHATITKLHDGRFEIEDGVNGAPSRKGIYAPDSYAIWRKVSGSQICEAGTPVRLGRYFQFFLP